MNRRNMMLICTFVSMFCLLSGCKNTARQTNEPASTVAVSSNSTTQSEVSNSDIVLISKGISLNKQTIEVICDVVFPDEAAMKNVNFDDIDVSLSTPMGTDEETGCGLDYEVLESKNNTKSCRLTYTFNETVLLGEYKLSFENLIEGDNSPRETSFTIDQYSDSLQFALNKTVFRTKINDPVKYQLDLLEAEIAETSLVISHHFDNDFVIVGGDVVIGFSDGSSLSLNHNKEVDFFNACDYETNTGYTIYNFDKIGKIDLTTVESISILGEDFSTQEAEVSKNR